MSMIDSVICGSSAIALELLDISGSRQKYTPSLVREMIRDMEDAGCTVDVVYEKRKKKKKNRTR